MTNRYVVIVNDVTQQELASIAKAIEGQQDVRWWTWVPGVWLLVDAKDRPAQYWRALVKVEARNPNILVVMAGDGFSAFLPTETTAWLNENWDSELVTTRPAEGLPVLTLLKQAPKSSPSKWMGATLRSRDGQRSEDYEVPYNYGATLDVPVGDKVYLTIPGGRFIKAKVVKTSKGVFPPGPLLWVTFEELPSDEERQALTTGQPEHKL